MTTEPKHISDILPGVIADLADAHAKESKEWSVVKRNRSITARNRFFQQHGEWLGLNSAPMPLEIVPHETRGAA